MYKIMKKTMMTALLSVLTLVVFAQFPGKRSKGDFKAIDGYTYKVGDVLQIGQALDGTKFRQVYIYTHRSTLDIIAAPLGQHNANFQYLSSDYKGFSAPIKYFKIADLQGTTFVFAILKIRNSMQRIAIPLNSALANGELLSLNPNFKADEIIENASLEKMDIKSFADGYNVELLSCKGDKNKQTVTLTFRITQNGVHKEVSVYSDSNDTEAYDAEGNEYKAKEVSVGANVSTFYSAKNKIPTGVPVKSTLTFHKILPSVKRLSYVNIVVKYGDYDDYYNKTKGNIEIRNLDIDWEN